MFYYLGICIKYMIQKASIVNELPIIVFWNKIYSTSMTSLCSIIQYCTMNQCTWLFRNKPRYKQDLMSSMKIWYSKRGIIDGKVNVLVLMLVINYGVFFLDKNHVSQAGIEPATYGLTYHRRRGYLAWMWISQSEK